MAHREPADPRCKDCPEPHEPNRSRCAACAERHRVAAAVTVAKRRKGKRCVTCGKPATGGTTLCSAHRAYYRERAATAAKP